MDNPVDRAKKKLLSLKQQHAEIEGQIHKWELFISTYEELVEDDIETNFPALRKAELELAEARAGLSLDGLSKKNRIEQTVANLLSDGVPKTTQVLYENLKAMGVPVSSASELSVYLSSAKELFQNDRRVGWSLQRPGKV